MTERRETTVLLIEDHVVVREGIRLLLERQAGISVVAECATAEEIVAVVGEPDLIVADLVLGAGRAADLVNLLRARFPHARVLILSMSRDPADVRGALDAGATGYLHKEAAARELIEAVRTVAAGGEYVEPALAVSLLRAPIQLPERRSPLTPREHDVLRLVADGHTNAEIAKVLHMSARTIEAHRSRIMDKLGVRGRAEVIRAARDQGLLG